MRRLETARGTMLPATLALLALLALASTGAVLAADVCRSSANTVLDSCADGAESDYLLALAKCANRAQTAARRACNQLAAVDRRNALETCEDQDDQRQAACGRLGPAPYDPAINPANFVAVIDNPYFPLRPGTTFIYEGRTAQGLEHGEFFVSHNAKVILGVTCVEVHDRVWVDGELIEDTLDWFAQDRTGNVWYFGENTKQLEGGLVVGLEGTWTAGVDGARPGIIMPAHPAAGNFNRQEFSFDNAEDVAEVLSLNDTVAVPFGSFDRCLKTGETNILSPGDVSYKYYAAGVGNLLTVEAETGERFELVRITRE